ncbi:MAG: universal stress protein [Phycisphaerae bacterium]|nr:universal stress protein [Phycisphaerae bacterium]
MDFSKALIAIDGSPHSEHALEVGLALARKLGAEVGLVTVVDPAPAVTLEAGAPSVDILTMLRQEAVQCLEKARAAAAGLRVSTHQREGAPAPEILHAATQWGASIIVVGSHGRTGLSRLFMGSTAENVARHADVPVLVTRLAGAKG